MTWSFDEKTQTERFLIASAIGMLIILAFIIAAPFFFPGGDKWALVWKLIMNVPMTIVGIICITGSILFVDFVSRRAWLNQIEETTYGPTAIYIAIILVIGQLLGGRIF